MQCLRLSHSNFEICIDASPIGIRLWQFLSSCLRLNATAYLLLQCRLKLGRGVLVRCGASNFRRVILRYVSMPRQLGSDYGIFLHHACGSVPQLTYCCSVVSSLAGAFWLDVVLQTFGEKFWDMSRCLASWDQTMAFSSIVLAAQCHSSRPVAERSGWMQCLRLSQSNLRYV